MHLHVTPPYKMLRTDHFKTSERSSTRGILVRYSNTVNDPRIDAIALDHFDACQSFFGCTAHYLVRSDGRVEVGRDPRTISSVAKGHMAYDHLVVSVVGGLDENGNLVANDTPEQEESLEKLLIAIATALDTPLEVTDNRAFLRNLAYADYLAAIGGEEIDDQETEAALDATGG